MAESNRASARQDKSDPPCVAMALSAHRFFGGKVNGFPPLSLQAVVLLAADPSDLRTQRDGAMSSVAM